MLKSLRWLWGESKGVRGRIAATALLGCATTGAALLFVWVTKTIVDTAVRSPESPLGWLIALLVGSLLLQLGSTTLAGRLEAECITRFSNALRGRLFSRLMRARRGGRSQMHTGDAVSRLTGDVGTASTTLASTLPGMASTAVKLIAAFIFMATLDVRMALCLVVIMPLALLASKIYLKKTRRLTREIREAESRLQQQMQEDLQHRLMMSTMGRTDASVESFRERQRRFFTLTMRRNDISLFSGGMVSAGFMAGYAVAFLWCAFGLRSGAVSFGMMTAFLQLVSQVQRPVVDLARRVPALVAASVSVERLQTLFALPVEADEASRRLKGGVGVRFEGVCFAYPDDTEGRSVVSDMTRDFVPGSLTSVGGPTGAGKTTLLMLMTGLLTPDKGQVTLYSTEGEEAVPSPATRCNFAYVPQGNSLMSGTVRENLLMAAPDASDAEMEKALRLACADFVLALPEGLDSPCGERGAGFSEGEAQRIAIARGLLAPGQVLLLDEPTSALDSATETRLLANLSESAGGKTVVMVTHRSGLGQTLRVGS
ncbi:MAG: ABC transporter ATP-binding protein [Muribaculaceae bacterium]|nr:ABC transporter ATP-binding protein [Muribaculaceae bacterium]